MRVTYDTEQIRTVVAMLDGLVNEVVLEVTQTAASPVTFTTDVLCMDISKVCIFQAQLACEADGVGEIGMSVEDLKTACSSSTGKQVTLDAGGGKIHISCGRLTYHFDYLEPMYITRAKAAKVAWDVIFTFDAEVFAVGINAIASLYKSDAIREAGIIFQYMPGTSFTMWDKDKAKLDSVYTPDEYVVKTEATRPVFAQYPLYYIGLMRKHLTSCDACQVKFAHEAPLGVALKKKGVTVGWVFAPRINEP